MDFKKTIVVIIQIIISVSAYSQIDSTFIDTINEITIYEYDTVYIQSDTIRLTDTIIDVIRINPVKKKKLYFPDFSFLNFSTYEFSIVPNSMGLNLAPYFSGYLTEKVISDSLSAQPVINMRYSAQFNYFLLKTLFTVCIGFSPFHEKFYSQRNYYTSNLGNLTPIVYDSLINKTEYTINYYYHYLNLSFSFGRKLELNRKWSLSMNIGGMSDFLVGYKQGNTSTPSSEVRKFDFLVLLNPQIAYKLKRNFELYLAPFYQHSLLRDKKYPYTSFQKMGIGIGFNINIGKKEI